MLRIGSAEGFYGDDVTRALPMIEGGHVDVVCFEALSELTLAILRRDQMRDPTRGYTRDIEVIAERILPLAYARKIPLITNGGGLNPAGAARHVMATAQAPGAGWPEHRYRHWRRSAATLERTAGGAASRLANIETGEPLTLSGPPIVTANAYLGAFPIAEALRQGADIVITGRVADPSSLSRADAAPLRLGGGRLEPARQRHHLRPPARMHRAGGRRQQPGAAG